MKTVTGDFGSVRKVGVAARPVKPVPQLRQRNPAARSFAGMGDWWDDLTSAASDTFDNLWDSAVDAGQKAATKLVQKELVKIIGADGKVQEVEAGSAQHVAYQQAQQQIALTQKASDDKMMKMMMYGGMAMGGIICILLAIKIMKK